MDETTTPQPQDNPTPLVGAFKDGETSQTPDVTLEPPKKRGRGRPRKEVAYAEIVRMKKAQAIIKHPSLKDAYKALYPNAKDSTAHRHAGDLLTPDVFDAVKNLLELNTAVKANKDVLEKVLFMVIARWMGQQEKTVDMISAVRELTKLVPEFSDKLKVEDVTNADEAELDRRLRDLGYDPTRVNNN